MLLSSTFTRSGHCCVGSSMAATLASTSAAVCRAAGSCGQARVACDMPQECHAVRMI